MILKGIPPIEVTLKPNARARRLSLRVSQLDGRVTLTLPKGAPKREAEAFVREKEGWIRGHLATQPDTVAVRICGRVSLDGREVEIVSGPGRRIQAEADRLIVPGNAETAPRRIKAWMKQAAHTRLLAASDRYAAKLGRPYSKITLRDARSRWGSCTQDGNLMYSWRLIMAPPEVLDYVAAHEVAHLAHMDHSAAFWAAVERLCPDYRAHRLWLREQGHRLHRYRFGD